MKRSILTITQRDGMLAASVQQSEPPLPDDWDERIPFGYAASALPAMTSDELVVQYGDRLAEGLCKHPAIAQVLQRAFGPNGADGHTVGLTVRADQGRQIRWETLRDPQGRFVALDGRCHIGRTVRRLAGTPQAAREFVPPLRVLAYLSGAGLDATEEWDALSAAIFKARDKGMPVEADVRIGQHALREQAEAEAAAKHPGAISVGAMPANASDLEVEIRDARPHILHFFCHGKAAMGASFLELATAIDHELGQPSSIAVSIDVLTTLAELRDVWLVVLNCCEGAQASPEIDSMAERMVESAGLAAAIGMLEPVTVGEASRFSAALYPEVFHALEDVLKMQPGMGTRFVNLAPAMSRPRRALRDLAPLRPGARWTLPVLFQTEEPLQVFRGAAPPLQPNIQPVPQPQPLPAPQPPAVAAQVAGASIARVKAETIAGMLAGLPPDTPGAVRDGMLALLDEAPVVPGELRPDRFGRFGTDLAGGGGGGGGN